MSEDGESRAESFYSGALARIPHFMIAVAVILSGAGWLRFGWRVAVGFACGCAIAYLNFHWLERVVSALADRATHSAYKQSSGGIVFRFLVLEALQAYPWPGNVRELRNVTERAMIITTGPVLHLDVPKIEQSSTEESGTLEEVEKRHIIEALNTTGWRVSGKDGAAEILGINPKTLESKMRRLGIQRNKKNA